MLLFRERRDGKILETVVRRFSQGEEDNILSILRDAFGSFLETQQPRRVLASSAFNPSASFFAIQDKSPMGCVAVISLPRANSYVVRYLAVKRSTRPAQTAEKLLARALEEVSLRNPDFVRGTTPAISPYVYVYKAAGFVPRRRDFRFRWNLAVPCGEEMASLRVKPITEGIVDEAARLFVETLAPLWNWRTEEEGGSEAVARSFVKDLMEGQRWVAGYQNDRMVGLTGLLPDYYGPGEARFRGVFVHPRNRGEGVGMTLMLEAANLARNLTQRNMTVYTFSYLDQLAPGALLYLRSGGKIDSEYLQLELPRARA